MADRFALIAAGGTGGHMFPAQSLAEVLLEKGWRVTLSTDDRGARYAGNFPGEVERRVVRAATTARGGIAGKLTAPFKIAAGVGSAITQFRSDRPDIVIGFGGYPTVPALSAALALRVPRMIHEQNGVMGRVNAMFARRVHQVACGTWPAELPAGVKGVHIGNPVRQSVLDLAATPYTAPGDGPLHVLIIGGSQGARVLSDIVPAAIALLPEAIRTRLQISHQARLEDTNRVTSAYEQAGVSTVVRPFFDDVPMRMAQAQLVISRAGASSIADLTVIGRPSILIPLAAAIRDEQTANARALSENGAAELLPEAVLDAESLARDIQSILSDPSRAEAMASAALALGRPDAAQRLYELVTEIAA